MDKRKSAGNIWLIIFSDITTNLMLFFLMLFAMTRMTEAQKANVQAGIQGTVNKSAREEAVRDQQSRKQKEESAVRDLKSEVSSGRLAGQADITVDDKTVKIVLNPEVFFQSGSSEISSDTKYALEGLLSPLKNFPNDIVIEGHTDNVPVRGGAYRSNWELSVARAVSVIDFFVSKGIDQRRLVAGGYGEYHPAYPNDTEVNRARNRRIEITIMRQPVGM